MPDNTITVSVLNRYIKQMIGGDPNLRRIVVKGEISNFTDHKKTGHFYFTLKDSSSSIRAVMFRGNAEKVRFTVENGMNVIITGSVNVFERDGTYQLYCETMEPDGMGALYLAFEQLKERLYQMGAFEESHKKPIPRLPQVIGVVTSPTGAALQDIRNILSRRYPLATLLVIPALVQGENAPASLVNAIELAQTRSDIDVLIVGRGGGSIEDLWCFNDERVAWAVYHCEIPVISAVGHEIDFTICDFVADLRAPTPSAAAELCAPDIRTLADGLDGIAAALDAGVTANFKTQYDRLKETVTRLNACSPVNRLVRAAEELPAKRSRRDLAMDRVLQAKEDRLTRSVASLEALSPLKVLTRGYAITRKDGQVVSSVRQVAPGDVLTTLVGDGSILSTVTRCAAGEEAAQD